MQGDGVEAAKGGGTADFGGFWRRMWYKGGEVFEKKSVTICVCGAPYMRKVNNMAQDFDYKREVRQAQAAIEASAVSNTINTAFIERHNGTDRNRNARKVRKSYCFSKDWDMHNAMTYFTMYSYNFCWPVRTLRVQDQNDRWHSRTPAMIAGLTDHIWSLDEWLTCPAVQLL